MGRLTKVALSTLRECAQLVSNAQPASAMLTYRPQVACSIGLMYRKEAVMGVIALPFMNQIASDRFKREAIADESSSPRDGEAEHT